MTLSFFEELDFDDGHETQPQEQPRRRPGFRGSGRSGGPRKPEVQRLAVLGVLILAVLFVGWYVITSCQDDAQKRAYHTYVQDVNSIAGQSKTVGQDLDNALNSADTTPDSLVSLVGQLASKHSGIEQNAAALHDTGKLKGQNSYLVQAMQYRTKGLQALQKALEKAFAGGKDISLEDATSVANEYSLLHSSDDIYRSSFQAPSQQALTDAGITDASINDSQFVPDASIVNLVPKNMQQVLKQITATGTTTSSGKQTCPSGAKIGTGIQSVVANPGAVTLVAGTSKSQATNVKSSSGLHFTVTIQNSGDLRVSDVQVRFIEHRTTPVQAQSTKIPQILSGDSASVNFTPQTPVPFGGPELITVWALPVHCETNTSNNKYTYPVLFIAG
jgi:hypothetical protein